jgi:hypothetical protein
MKRFNGNNDIEIGLRKRIELHFANKWKNDRNQAIDDPEEIEILSQLPEFVVTKIFKEFLYS